MATTSGNSRTTLTTSTFCSDLKASVPLQPGARNQFNGGFQQRITKYVIFDGDYFWKFTHNAYDFDVLFNTPITFPIAWHNSKVDGFTGRFSSINYRGLQAS